MRKPIFITRVKIGKAERQAIERVFDSGMIAQGAVAEKFEKEFAQFCGTKYAVAVSSGTAALNCACFAAGIKSGDEVITTPFTFIATANAPLLFGAKPVFADIKEETFNLDSERVEEKITKRTKAVITVDLFGQPADYRELRRIARKHRLVLIEDAAQAHGAKLEGKKTGALGHIGCFSFYATKNMTTGEGGMVVTDNKDYAQKARLFRQHGEAKKYDYVCLGFNYHTTDIATSIGRAQLRRLPRLNQRRIKNAQFYYDDLEGIKGLILPVVKKEVRHVFHQFTIRVTPDFKLNRDQFYEYLKRKNIFCGIYYPQSLHLYPHFKKLGYKKGDFPIAERVAKEVISLPVHPYLTQSELKYIVKVIKSI